MAKRRLKSFQSSMDIRSSIGAYRSGSFGDGNRCGKQARYDEKNPGFWASLSQQRDEYLHFLTKPSMKQR